MTGCEGKCWEDLEKVLDLTWSKRAAFKDLLKKHLNTVCWNIYVHAMLDGITAPCLSVLWSLFLKLLAGWELMESLLKQKGDSSHVHSNSDFGFTPEEYFVLCHFISETSTTNKRFLLWRPFCRYLRPKALECMTHFQYMCEANNVQTPLGCNKISRKQKTWDCVTLKPPETDRLTLSAHALKISQTDFDSLGCFLNVNKIREQKTWLPRGMWSLLQH